MTTPRKPLTKATTIAVPPSDTGYWSVDLSRVFEHAGFPYCPGAAITVDRSVLDAMIADDVVTRVVAAA